MIRRRGLAKLRNFIKGMDVEEYLVGEMRQNLLAIERFMQKKGFTSQDAAIPDEIFGEGDLYATFIGSFGLGTVFMSNANLKSGKIEANTFYPEKSGTYWVEFGAQIFPVTSGGSTNSLILRNSSNVDHHTLLVNGMTGATGMRYLTGKREMQLSPTIGARFALTGNADNVGSNFYCSFTRIK